MDLKQLLLVIGQNSTAPTNCNCPKKLPNALQNLTPDEIEEAIIISIRKGVESRGIEFQNLQGSEFLEKIAGAVSWLTGPQRRTCLQLQGVPGTGKSTLMNAVYDVLRAGGASITKTTSQNLFDCFELYKNGSSPAFYEYMTQQRLCIDDFGAEPNKCLIWGVEYTPLQTLFDFRYERQLPTIITTNLSDESISDRYGERLADRFEEMCTILRFNGQSYRR